VEFKFGSGKLKAGVAVEIIVVEGPFGGRALRDRSGLPVSAGPLLLNSGLEYRLL
jgi:hypothetical protein